MGEFAFIISGIFMFLLFLLFLNIITSIWAYKDAKRNGKGQDFAIVILAITLVFPVVGLIVYLFIRHD